MLLNYHISAIVISHVLTCISYDTKVNLIRDMLLFEFTKLEYVFCAFLSSKRPRFKCTISDMSVSHLNKTHPHHLLAHSPRCNTCHSTLSEDPEWLVNSPGCPAVWQAQGWTGILDSAWWRHDIETLSPLLWGESSGFPSQRDSYAEISFLRC